LRSEEFKESAALYALGALDVISARRLEGYLQTANEDEWQEFREMQETAALLPLVLPEITPGPQIRQTLLSAIAHLQTNVVASAHSVPRLSPLWQRLLIAATIILTLGCGWLFWQNQRLTGERDQALARSQASEQQLAVARTQWNEMLSPATRVISLSGDSAPQASAKLLWDTRQQQWVLHISNLPALPADKDYQLWYLTSDQSKVSATVFRTDEQGRTELRLSLPPTIAGRLAATAVSLEPRGGSPQPTGQIVLKGMI